MFTFFAAIDQGEVTVVAAATIVFTAIGTTWKLARSMSGLRSSISVLSHNFELFKKDLEIKSARAGRTLSRREFRAWLMVTLAQNPGWKAQPLADEPEAEEEF